MLWLLVAGAAVIVAVIAYVGFEIFLDETKSGKKIQDSIDSTTERCDNALARLLRIKEDDPATVVHLTRTWRDTDGVEHKIMTFRDGHHEKTLRFSDGHQEKVALTPEEREYQEAKISAPLFPGAKRD